MQQIYEDTIISSLNMYVQMGLVITKSSFDAYFFKLNISVYVTCEDIICVKFHVHSVFLCYVSHDPLGAAVLLSGQQPTQ